MRNTTKLYILLAVCTSVFILSITGCEPKDWDVILAAPEPVQNLIVDTASIGLEADKVDIPVTYTPPSLPPRVAELYPNYSYEILFSYRQRGEAVKAVSFDSVIIQKIGTELLGTEIEFYVDIPEEELENGAEYIITVYVIDGEGQLSEGVESDPFIINW